MCAAAKDYWWTSFLLNWQLRHELFVAYIASYYIMAAEAFFCKYTPEMLSATFARPASYCDINQTVHKSYLVVYYIGYSGRQLD